MRSTRTAAHLHGHRRRIALLLAGCVLPAALSLAGEADPWARVSSADLHMFQNTRGYAIQAEGLYSSAVGDRVAGVGDFNGDGLADVAVNRPTYGMSAGVFIRWGKDSGTVDRAPVEGSGDGKGIRITPEDYYDDLGAAIAGIGDFNGDGYSDVAIGAPGFYRFLNNNLAKSGGPDVGAVYIIFGSPDPAPIDLSDIESWWGRAKLITWSNQEVFNVGIGTSVASVGDLDGDGLDDIIIGAPWLQGSEPDSYSAGGAFVVYGTYDMTSEIRLEDIREGLGGGYVITRESGEYTELGTAVAGAGDVNGDGIPDLLLGEPGGDDYHGNCWLIYGRGERSTEPQYVDDLNEGEFGFRIISPANPGDGYGTTVAGLGDINGDGLSDFAVGAPRFDGRRGGVWVILGTKDSPVSIDPLSKEDGKVFSLLGSHEDALTGTGLFAAGDVNGDGLMDILIGTPNWVDEDTSTTLGMAQVIWGSAEPEDLGLDHNLPSDRGWTILGSVDFGGFGSSVSAAGDVNGDGFGDIIVGVNSADAPSARPTVAFGYALPARPEIVDLWAETEVGQSIVVQHTGGVEPDSTKKPSIGVWYRETAPTPGGWVFMGLQVYEPGQTELTVPWAAYRSDANFTIAARARGDFAWIGPTVTRQIIGISEPYNPSGTSITYDDANRELIVSFSDPGFGPTSLGLWTRPILDTTALQTESRPLGNWTYHGLKPVASEATSVTIPLDRGADTLLVQVALRNMGAPGFGSSVYGFATAPGAQIYPRMGRIYYDRTNGGYPSFQMDPPGNVPGINYQLYSRQGQPPGLPADSSPWTDEGVFSLPAEPVEARPVNYNYFAPAAPPALRELRAVMYRDIPPTFAPPYNYFANEALSDTAMAARARNTVIYGPADTLDQHAFRYAAINPGDEYGSAVAVLGDLNGDGIEDIAVGAPYSNTGGAVATGAVLIHLMNAEGTAHHTVHLTPIDLGLTPAASASARMGTSLAGLNDVDGDGIPDLAVGLPGASSDLGEVHIVFLHADGSVKATSRIGAGSPGFLGSLPTGAEFGASLSAAGDLNLDGRPDLLVGAPGIDSSTGRIFTLFLSTTGTVSAFTQIGNGFGMGPTEIASGSRFGRSIAYLGDLNGDGHPEIAVGQRISGDGVLRLVSIQGIDGAYVGTTGILPGTPGGEDFGAALASAGDVTGDGRPDLFAGAPDSDDGGSVYLLSFNSDLGIANIGGVYGDDVDPNTIGGLGYGTALAVYPDTDGDRVTYLLLGLPTTQKLTDTNEGGIAIVMGTFQPDASFSVAPFFALINILEGNATLLLPSSGPVAFGHSVVAIGDLDDDGVRELAIGAPGFTQVGPADGAVFIAFPNTDGTIRRAVRLSRGWSGLGVESEFFGSQYGWSLSVQWGELLWVGAPAYNGDRGAVEGVRLNGNGFVAAPTEVIGQPADVVGNLLSAGDRFGSAVAYLGLITNDPYPEIIVGAPGHDSTVVDGGRLYVITPPSDLNGVMVVSTIDADSPSLLPFAIASGEGFGESLAAASLSGPNDTQVLAGLSYRDTSGGADDGAFLMISIDDMGGVSDADVYAHDTTNLRYPYNWPNSRFGAGLGIMGDYDGDGWKDILVGASGYEEGWNGLTPAERGAVFLVRMFGGTPGYSKLFSDVSGNIQPRFLPGGRFGASATGIGDFDGDGYRDMVVGAPGSPTDPTGGVGQIYLIRVGP